MISCMRTVAAVGIGAAAVLLAGCQHAAEPHAKAAERVQPVAVAIAARTVSPQSAVGALFLGATDTHTCSGSVIHSASKDLVLTAAHCLAQEYPATFVPGFADTADPGEVWTVDAVYLDPRWVATQDPNADYAFLRVSRPAGGSIETIVGAALTLGAAPVPSSPVTVVGYPMGWVVSRSAATPSPAPTPAGSRRCSVVVWSTAQAALPGSPVRTWWA